MNITLAETINKGEIKFKRGSHSATVSGTVIRGERDQYSLIAGAGQWMEVKISSPEDNAVFQLSIYSYGTGEDVQLEGAKAGEDARYWYDQLPAPGYSKDGKQNAVDIIVGGMRGNASYDLTLTIKNEAEEIEETTDDNQSQANSVNGKYQNLLQTMFCPQDKAQYGEFSDYGYWAGGAWCGQMGQAGYWVWKYPNWYVWAKKAQLSDKVTIGTVLSMEAGDRGCYVEFTDNNGKNHSEMAAFEICEQTDFIGKKVKFSYTKESIMASSCAGDPECTQSETVWLINDMK